MGDQRSPRALSSCRHSAAVDGWDLASSDYEPQLPPLNRSRTTSDRTATARVDVAVGLPPKLRSGDYKLSPITFKPMLCICAETAGSSVCTVPIWERLGLAPMIVISVVPTSRRCRLPPITA